MADELDPLELSALFAGSEQWLAALKPTLERLPEAASFIGPGRGKSVVPVRELTFQALKPHPPERWKVVVFGQNPYPRVESATGIAMFDNAFGAWSDGRFGSVTSIRCIIKAACMWKHGVPKPTPVSELRALLKTHQVVAPPEWFQAMLTQGVLLLNASLTASSDGALSTAQHTAFWKPVIEKTVEEILRAKRDCSDAAHQGVVFAWWGAHAKALRKTVEKLHLKYPEVTVTHLDHCNPAAMGDAFCDGNPFGAVNQALGALGSTEVDWLPAQGWKDRLAGQQATASRMGEFINETMELHKLYLERLEGAKEEKLEELSPIEGVLALAALPLADAAATLASLLPGLPYAIARAREYGEKSSGFFSKLSAHEAGALHLYTLESALYRQLNSALRHPDRHKSRPYFGYLKLFLTALQKLEPTQQTLWRGVKGDLRAQYLPQRQITWWGVSSCTPKLEVARSFLGGAGHRTLFEVLAHRAVSIKKYSAFQGEEEFVLAPGTRLKVAAVSHQGGLTQVQLVELPEVRRVS